MPGQAIIDMVPAAATGAAGPFVLHQADVSVPGARVLAGTANRVTVAVGASNVTLSLPDRPALGGLDLIGTLDMGSSRILAVASPLLGTDAVNKSYVDSAISASIAGLDMQESVLDRDLTTPPGAPTMGDRYVVAAGGTDAWAGHDEQIAEWDGAAWQFTTPDPWTMVAVEDEGKVLYYTSTWPAGEWLTLDLVIDHGALLGLGDDDHSQYMHIANARTVTAIHTFDPVVVPGDSDDFGDGILDAVRWGSSTGGSGTVVEAGGFATTTSPTVADAALLYAKAALVRGGSVTWRFRSKLNSATWDASLLEVHQAAAPAVGNNAAIVGAKRIGINTRTSGVPKFMILYRNSSDQNIFWNGTVWTATSSYLDTPAADTLYTFELVTTATGFSMRIKSGDGLTLIQSTTEVPWSSLKDTGQSDWVLCGDPYTDFYSGILSVDEYASEPTQVAPFGLAGAAVDALVIGLNADRWDGAEFADYIDQGVRTTDSPTHVAQVLSVGAAPTATADRVKLYAADLAAGDAVLGIVNENGATALINASVVSRTMGLGAPNLVVGHAGNVAKAYAAGNMVIAATERSASISGTSNVLLGDYAGNMLTTGYGNMLMGYNAGSVLDVGYQNVAVGTSTLIGTGSAGSFRNIAIGNNALGNVTGLIQTAVAIGFQAGYNADAASTNGIAIGSYAFFTYLPGTGVAIGNQAGRYATGTQNTLIGSAAGVGVSGQTTGVNCTAIGFSALRSLTSGGTNTAVGMQAGYYVTTGTSNVLIGNHAGMNQQTPSYNTFVGTYVGYNPAAAGTVTGGNNTALGAFAMYNVLTSGSYNVAAGRGAGAAITSGSNNVLLGYNADLTDGTLNYVIAIGYNAKASLPNSFVVGGSGAERVNLLLGTSSYGTGARGAIVVASGVVPGSNVADAFQLCAADFVPGNAVPTFYTENGTLIQLVQNLATTSSVEFAKVMAAGSYASLIRTSDAYKYAASATVTAGTVVSGTFVDTQSLNMVYHQIGEVVATPGFDLYYEWTGVTGNPRQVHLTGRYEGSAPHVVLVYAWNWGLAQWDRLTAAATDIPNTSVDASYNFEFPTDPSAYLGTGGDAGKVRFRIAHTSAGVGTHNLYIDYLYLVQQSYALATRGTAYDLTDLTDSASNDTTVSGAAGTVTILTAATYRVYAKIDFMGGMPPLTIAVRLAKNGVANAAINITRRLESITSIGSASDEGIITLAASDVLKLQAFADVDDAWIAAHKITFNVERIN